MAQTRAQSASVEHSQPSLECQFTRTSTCSHRNSYRTNRRPDRTPSHYQNPSSAKKMAMPMTATAWKQSNRGHTSNLQKKNKEEEESGDHEKASILLTWVLFHFILFIFLLNFLVVSRFLFSFSQIGMPIVNYHNLVQLVYMAKPTWKACIYTVATGSSSVSMYQTILSPFIGIQICFRLYSRLSFDQWRLFFLLNTE